MAAVETGVETEVEDGAAAVVVVTEDGVAGVSDLILSNAFSFLLLHTSHHDLLSAMFCFFQRPLTTTTLSKGFRRDYTPHHGTAFFFLGNQRERMSVFTHFYPIYNNGEREKGIGKNKRDLL